MDDLPIIVISLSQGKTWFIRNSSKTFVDSRLSMARDDETSSRSRPIGLLPALVISSDHHHTMFAIQKIAIQVVLPMFANHQKTTLWTVDWIHWLNQLDRPYLY